MGINEVGKLELLSYNGPAIDSTTEYDHNEAFKTIGGFLLRKHSTV